MQEAPDGCLISNTYLDLIASFEGIRMMNIMRLDQPGYTMSQNTTINDSIHEADNLDQSYLGLNNVLVKM